MKIVESIVLLFATIATAAAPQAVSTVTVHAWPLSAASPTPFATIAISPSQKAIQAKVQSINQPAVSTDELVRVGILDDSNTWSGVATSAKSFGPDVSKKIVLHTDNEGRVAHISFNAFESARGEEEAVFVEVIPIQAGPKPTLNKPVVLDETGRLAAPETADTKSFLQK
jgi:hypothetical protein